MKHHHSQCPFKFSVEETEEGYTFHVKGDKEKLKAKGEAIEAFHKHSQGIISLFHKHVQAFQRRQDTCGEHQEAEKS